MNRTIRYRRFSFEQDSREALFALYAATYGNSERYGGRWAWEHERNPLKEDLSIFVAEIDDQIVGSTTRLPVHLHLQDGGLLKGAFSVNSMVHPDFRGRGIIGELYRRSFREYPFLFSKGTAPRMYKLLLSYGYAPVEPSTFQVKVLAPVKWLLWRTGRYKPSISPWKDANRDNFSRIDRFGDEHERFIARVANQFAGLPHKDARYLNWRYVDIPFRQYRAFAHITGNEMSAIVVLGSLGSTGAIVDLTWDRNVPGEPGATLQFAVGYLRDHGFIKARCWSSMSFLRSELHKAGFKQTADTPHFSYFSGADQPISPETVKTWLVCEGDGDSEYLGR